jgi:membrane-associated phospholipid phosphatase
MPLRIVAAFVLLAVAVPLDAQQTARQALNTDAAAFFHDGWHVVSAPARFDGQDWLYVALTAGATVAAFVVDDDVRVVAQSHNPGRWDIPLTVGEKYGSGLVSGALGLGLIGAGALTGDDHTRITGRMVLQSLLYSAAITMAVKVLTGRSRPFENEGKGRYRWMRAEDARQSFPSGHTTIAFALSSTLSRRIGSTPVSVLLYGLSTLTALERIASDRHWLSDTVLGAAIGSVVGLAVVRLEEEREMTGDVTRFPDVDDGEIGTTDGVPWHQPLLQWSFSF